MADAIFISYRRDDSEGEAGRLFDDLTRAFGSEAVFMDVAGIKPGVDFRKAIEQNVASCGVLLAIIGPAWLTATNPDGKRRLEDSSDFVALEIASALRRDVPVIPVLVHDAKMPPADRLPESIANLAYHNSVEISHARWSSDVALLIEALKAYVTPVAARQAEPPATVHATVPVQLPAPHPPNGTITPQPAKSRASLMVGAALVAIVVVGAAVYEAMKSRNVGPDVKPSPAPVVVPPATNPVKEAAAATTVPAQAATTKAVAAKNSKDPASAAPASSLSTGYVGTWKRSGGGGSDTIGLLVIATSGTGTTVHAYGGCQGPACDWGSQPATMDDSGNVVATFAPSPSGSNTSRTARVIAHTVPQGLDVLVQNTFLSPSGTRQNSMHRLFVNAQ